MIISRNKTFLGSSAEVVGNRTDLYKFINKIYNSHSNKVFGMFESRQPTWIIRDPTIIKQIAVKDFDHFEDHRKFMDDETDDFLANSLVTMRGETWRDMRATLSPAFTGSKLRNMFELVSECADELLKKCAVRKQSN